MSFHRIASSVYSLHSIINPNSLYNMQNTVASHVLPHTTHKHSHYLGIQADKRMELVERQQWRLYNSSTSVPHFQHMLL